MRIAQKINQYRTHGYIFDKNNISKNNVKGFGEGFSLSSIEYERIGLDKLKNRYKIFRFNKEDFQDRIRLTININRELSYIEYKV